MTKDSNLNARIETVVDSPDMLFEDLVLDITGEIIDVMETKQISRSELARRIGVRPPHVTRMLQGQDNFTLRTLARISHALGMAARVTLAPAGSTTRFVHTLDGSKETVRMESAPKTSRRGGFKTVEFGKALRLDSKETESAPEKKVGGAA